MPQHGRKRDQVNPRHRCTCSPGMAKIVQAQGSDSALFEGPVVSVVHLRDLALRVRLTRKDVCSLGRLAATSLLRSEGADAVM
jgi:hypothetical protein